jgi:hypothetical protein
MGVIEIVISRVDSYEMQAHLPCSVDHTHLQHHCSGLLKYFRLGTHRKWVITDVEILIW